MIPSFLKPTEAQKILLIGKSINFLREVCHQVPCFMSHNDILMVSKNNKYFIYCQKPT